jgi:hypothetical protein
MPLAVTQLAGFGGATLPAITSLTQVAQNFAEGSNTAGRTTWPAVQAGDVAVLVECLANAIGVPPAAAVPTGFTQIATATLGAGADDRIVTSAKLCTGSESGSIVGMTVGTFTVSRQQIVIFRGNVPATAISVQSGTAQVTDAAPTNQVVTSSAAIVPAIVLGWWSSAANAITSRGMSPAKDAEYGGLGAGGLLTGDDTLYTAWKFYNVGSSPANVTVSANDVGNDNGMSSCYLNVS